MTRYTYDRVQQRVVERQPEPPTNLVEPLLTPHAGVTRELQQLDREMRDATYGNIRESRFDTLRGRHAYNTRDSLPVSECWLELNDIRYLLPQRPYYECVGNDQRILGIPTSFSFAGTFLYLWPTPDNVYRVGFIQGQCRPNRVEFQGVPLHFDGGFSGAQADQKAIDLLKEWLTPKQLRDFEKTSSFVVKGNVTNKTYRITKTSTFGVKELGNKNNTVRSLCFVPSTAYAVGDIMLAQKIMLETREDEVLKIANFSPSPGASGVVPTRAIYEELAAITRHWITSRYGWNDAP